MITDVAQHMIGNADRLRQLAGGGVQQNEQQDVASIFSNILKSAGQSGAQWSDGERVRLITGALDFVSAGQDPNAQGAALQSFSGLVRRLASDDVLGGGGRRPDDHCGCNGSGGAEPTAPTTPPSSGGSCGGSSGEPFKVNGNTVDTGRYCISASNEESGRLEVTDKQTGKKFKVWGDPHIETGDGDKTDFHKKAATFELPDGTKITIDPTNGEGKTFIEKVAITRGDQAAEMTGFRGNLKTELKSGQGQALDQQYEDGTVLKTKNGEIDDLVLPNGQEITGNNIKDIDGFAGTGPTNGTGAGQGTDDQILQNLNGVIDGLNLSPQEKEALKTVVSLLGRVMNGAGSVGGGQQPQPIAAPRTDEGGEAAPTQQQSGAGGGPFDQILSALSSLIGRLNLPQNEKDALATVVSLLGRLLGGAGGGQQDIPQAA
nr:type III effector NopE [Bradyrhizobium sp.]